MTKLAAIRSSAKVIDGATAASDLALSADVVVIGTGAGGAVAAAVLAKAGLDVLMVEEGGYYSAEHDFTMREAEVVPKLYQESMQRTTADLAISVLQGRAVGGSTVVNWTTSFRTPEDVVAHWRERHAVKGFSYEDLAPHYDAIEERLHVKKVDEGALNQNNRKLFDGCKALGWHVETTRRNVFSCMQTGACGLGCPVNAKRSMLVTMVPDAIDLGARLVFRCRADKLVVEAGAVTSIHATLFDGAGARPSGKKASIQAKTVVLAGGAINSPALLLRSALDENGRVGLRTFLHPVVASAALYDDPIEAFYGAPQSAASHHFAHRGDEPGFFMEAAPAYPMLSATATPGMGAAHADAIATLNRRAFHIALAIDGFHDALPGGRVKLRASGAPLVDYPIPDALWSLFRFAQARLAEIAFASGAREVLTLHEPAGVITSKSDLAKIDSLPWRPGSVGVFTAHQMGGCAMGDDKASAVVDSETLRHHVVKNLHVIDGSVFPTSLGVNPQESIYGLSHLMATRLASKLT